MFGVRLPINFRSPYKSINLIQFWRSWHITLSRFLRDYLYYPLGGNRCGVFRRYQNLLIVMVLGGLWHGAGWTFMVWGAIHGCGLMINHMWQRWHPADTQRSRYSIWAGVAGTFIFVTIAWAFFRAQDIPAAINILSGLVGANGVVLPHTYYAYLGPVAPLLAEAGVVFKPVYFFQGISQVIWLSGLLAVVWAMPTTLDWVGYEETKAVEEKSRLKSMLFWKPNIIWALVLSGAAIACLVYISQPSEFLYFQF